MVRYLVYMDQLDCDGEVFSTHVCWNYKKADWKRFRELTDIYTKSITFSKHSVNKDASNFNSAVLKAAKESIPRGRRHDYKPYWNNTLEKIHKELSEAREEMERNPTPQNVRRHSQLKVDLDKEKQTQTQASWKTKTASLNMERETQKLWQLTKSLNGDNSGQNNTANHKWSCHRKGGSKCPCQSF